MGCPTEVEIGANLVFSVNTHTFATGAATDADAVPSYRIYEDETGTAILTGNMAKLDDDNTTGFYSELIACTVANGFENGKTYTIYITATVASVAGAISFGFIAYDARKANLTHILGTLLTETAGYLAAAFKKLFNVAIPVLTCESVNQTADSGAVTNKLDSMITDIEGDYVFSDIALHNTYYYMDVNSSKLGTLPAPTVDEIKTALEADGSKLDHLWEMTEDDDGTRRLTENALEEAPTSGTAPTIEEIRQEIDANSTKLSAILEDTGTTIPALINANSGAGAISFAYTLTNTDTNTPIDGAEVWVTTDAAGVNVVASGTTDAYGVVNFMLDAGTVYLWRKKSGINFVNPDIETIS